MMQQSDTLQAVDIGWKALNSIWVGIFERLPFVIIAFIVLVVFWMFGRLLQKVLLTAGDRTRLDGTLARLFGRLISAATFILGLLVGAVIVFPTFQPGDLVAGLGITSVAIGFAFKDVLQNFFAGILLLWRRPFVIGDVIVVNGYSGTVEEINVRATRLKTFDNERAIIPNGDVYTSAVLVKTAYPALRLILRVGIGYQDDIETARRLMEDVLRKTEGVFMEPAPLVVVTELAASSVDLTIYFWINPRDNGLKISDRVATGIKSALDNAGIEIPFPHSVVLFRDQTERRREDARSDTASEQTRPA